MKSNIHKKATFEDKFSRKFACWKKNSPKAWRFWKRLNRKLFRKNTRRMNDMARYIDADALGIGKADRNAFGIPQYADGWNSAIKIIENAPAADVVPASEVAKEFTCFVGDPHKVEHCPYLEEVEKAKSEVDRLEYTLLGVMHSVDKWLDGDELKQDEVNRAITMREKTLRIIETLKGEVERLERILNSYALQYGTVTYQQKVIDKAKSEVAREIFEEIEKTIRGALVIVGLSYKHNPKEIQCKKECYEDFLGYVAELKKKYTVGENQCAEERG